MLRVDRYSIEWYNTIHFPGYSYWPITDLTVLMEDMV